MTPKEKANHLVNKLWVFAHASSEGSWKNAKLCAFICADEAFKERQRLNEEDYWLQVKEEIEKL